MRRTALAMVVMAALVLSGCSKKKTPAANTSGGGTASDGTAVRGLPPSNEKIGVHSPEPGQGKAPSADPHAGMDMGAGAAVNPHAGMDMKNSHGGAPDPHAGMDMGKGKADPHGGGMAEPDPHTAAGSTISIEGTIDVAPKFKAQIPPGAVLFISARNLKSKSVVGVGRVEAGKFPVPFKLDASSAMNGQGMNAKDRVLITVNVDKDGDPMKKQGELEALLEAEVPQAGIKLVIDHVREAP